MAYSMNSDGSCAGCTILNAKISSDTWCTGTVSLRCVVVCVRSSGACAWRLSDTRYICADAALQKTVHDKAVNARYHTRPIERWLCGWKPRLDSVMQSQQTNQNVTGTTRHAHTQSLETWAQSEDDYSLDSLTQLLQTNQKVIKVERRSDLSKKLGNKLSF